MSRSNVIAFTLMAAALGFLLGSQFERRRIAKPPAAAPEKKVDEPAPAPEPPRADLKSTAERAIAEERWPAAVEAVRTVIASGMQAWPDALALILEMLSVSDPVEYALREEALHPLSAEVSFHKYGVEHARELDSFAGDLYLQLAYAWLAAAGEGKFLFVRLARAPEDEIQEIVRALDGNVTPDMLSELAARARAARNPAVILLYLKVIASAGAPAEKTLRDLSSAPEPVLAEGAAVALQMIRPPVSGFLVLNVQQRERPGSDRPNGERPNGEKRNPGAWTGPVRRGDIIVQVGEEKIVSEKSWKEAVKAAGGRGAGTIEVKLVRKGETLTVTVPGNAANLARGKFVEAAKTQ